MSVPPSPGSATSEVEFHLGLEAWAREHARRYPDMGVIDYDPARYPGQCIETSRSDAVVDDGTGRRRCGMIYERTMGAEGAATLAALGTPAVEIRRLLSAGKNVAVLTAHADQLHDIGALCAGFAVAFADRDLVARNGTILNKVMSRESFRGTPIEELFRPFGNVYWVIPATASADRWGLSPEVVARINGAALRRVAEDMRAGLLLTFAPGGSAMRRVVDDRRPAAVAGDPGCRAWYRESHLPFRRLSRGRFVERPGRARPGDRDPQAGERAGTRQSVHERHRDVVIPCAEPDGDARGRPRRGQRHPRSE